MKFQLPPKMTTHTLIQGNCDSPVSVLIIDDQQDLGLAYDRFRWLTATRSPFSGCCCRWLGVCGSGHVLGHLSAFHHAGEGAEEAPWAWGGARARAWTAALGLARDAGGLPPLRGRGGWRGGGGTRRGWPLQVHHVAVGKVGHEAAVWQAPAEVVHGDGLVGQSGQRRRGRKNAWNPAEGKGSERVTGHFLTLTSKSLVCINQWKPV